MKTKLLLSLLFTFVFYLVSSQVPQGFNYQAIARDGSGNPIVGATIKVKLSILTDTAGFRPGGGGTYVWEEEHTGVVTNAYGLFTIVFGNPVATRVQGVANFSAINWNQPKLYLGTKIANPSTYKPLGGAILWSVPYALVSGNLSGPVKKLAIKSLNTSPDSAIFEVKNNMGQTVFAVYNEGVRIYVDDGYAKGITKGGFAIGGFGTDKGTSQNYFTVSRDSIRAYVNDTIAKGITKGGFAIGGFGTAKGPKQEYFRVTRDSTRIYVNDLPGGKGITKGGFAIGGFDVGKTGLAPTFFDVFPDSSGKVFPARNKILWYPLKNALLAGRVLIQNKDSVGENSFATGFESEAKGKYSQAMGFKAIARGDFSTAIGKNAVAGKNNSFAFGDSARATNEESYALGRGALASGYRSFAFGSGGTDYYGYKSNVSQAKGISSFAIGMGCLASGDYSFSIGISDTASGLNSVAIGYGNNAKSLGSVSIGLYNVTSGMVTTGIGFKNKAIGNYTTTIGVSTIASGDYSFAIGNNITAQSGYETVIGRFNSTYIPVSEQFWNNADRLFIIGNGTGSSTRSNAFIVYKNGNAYVQGSLGIGTSSPTNNLDVNGGSVFGNAPEKLSINSTSLAFNRKVETGTIYNSGAYAYQFQHSGSTIQGSDYLGLQVYNTSGISVTAAALAVNGYGNVGIGTAMPNEKLEISGANSKISLNSTGSNMIIYNNNGTAAPSFTSRSVGTKIVLFQQLNTTNADYALGIDASTLWYSIPQAVSSAAHKFYAGTSELMRIRGDGNVGIGTTAPGYKLTVNGTAWCSSGAWTGSDIRWKKNILPLDNTLKGIMSLQAVNYDLRTDEFPQLGFESGSQIGLIAQDVEKIFPLLVSTDNNGFKAVAYDKLSVVLIEAVKEQQQIIQKQQIEIDHLKSLENEVEELKVLVNSFLVNQSGKGNR